MIDKCKYIVLTPVFAKYEAILGYLGVSKNSSSHQSLRSSPTRLNVIISFITLPMYPNFK